MTRSPAARAGSLALNSVSAGLTGVVVLMIFTSLTLVEGAI
ncbi:MULTISPECIES: hypothetical protein [unclassified Hyphomonas]|jgi:hypothetical protein|nr:MULTISPECIES: hypothetical protein [unclassified Hyphomonas]KCZ46722.1 hypothetical protein HY17_08220 [Hyphomonas sp. CY54-11-8]RAN39445.1 hypothetical protein HY26_15545 [Hyphomonas sp. GM-8P]